jgi:hypothetical protein
MMCAREWKFRVIKLERALDCTDREPAAFMKAKIWVLCTVLTDENAPAMPAVFADEAEARAATTPRPDPSGPWRRMGSMGIDGPRHRNSRAEAAVEMGFALGFCKNSTLRNSIMTAKRPVD